jgi:hypothetical protein
LSVLAPVISKEFHLNHSELSNIFGAVVASVTGLSRLAAGLAGTLFALLVGTLVDHFSYFPAFL